MIIFLFLFLFLIFFVLFLYNYKKNNKLKGILLWKSGRKKGRFIYKSSGLKSLEDLIRNNELLSIAISTTNDIKDLKYKEDLINDILIETSGIKHFLLQKTSFSDYPTPKTFTTVRNIYNEDIRKIKHENKELEKSYIEYQKTGFIVEEYEEEFSRISLLQSNLSKNLKK